MKMMVITIIIIILGMMMKLKIVIVSSKLVNLDLDYLLKMRKILEVVKKYYQI